MAEHRNPGRPSARKSLTEEDRDERDVMRLFALCDAVFAIAMTLLALDLKVPDLGASPDDATLRRALADLEPRYLSFLVSFYAIASYWRRHREEMRSVRVSPPVLVRLTLFLLLTISVLPFVSNVLGSYGAGIAVAAYAGVNVLAAGTLLVIRHVVDRVDPPAGEAGRPPRRELWFDLTAFVLAVPAGYVFPGEGPEALIALLALSAAVSFAFRRLRGGRAHRRRRS
ncbi:TMEM175 family protein [Streptomyces sp. NBC_01498]|uniref:TMEM175 family protein n=1 Tax=Streptomyces sp. NBC_01498 TaxID=2975870 RepID=UPI002E7B7CBE|nr:TMEM175 family protein [Streptomyces sp. NBC_01498]WTL28531.1 TMEM175 family protein [Streptomyces sp. NBC_01498]